MATVGILLGLFMMWLVQVWGASAVGATAGGEEEIMTTAKSRRHAPVKSISGVSVPDTKLAQEIAEFIRDTETELLFNHFNRVYFFGALAGERTVPYGLGGFATKSEADVSRQQ
jgi:hypothetical protein